jgi:hypothetical protein
MEYNPMLEPTLADSHVDYCLNPEKELSTEKEMHIVSNKRLLKIELHSWISLSLLTSPNNKSLSL